MHSCLRPPSVPPSRLWHRRPPSSPGMEPEHLARLFPLVYRFPAISLTRPTSFPYLALLSSFGLSSELNQQPPAWPRCLQSSCRGIRPPHLGTAPPSALVRRPCMVRTVRPSGAQRCARSPFPVTPLLCPRRSSLGRSPSAPPSNSSSRLNDRLGRVLLPKATPFRPPCVPAVLCPPSRHF